MVQKKNTYGPKKDASTNHAGEEKIRAESPPNALSFPGHLSRSWASCLPWPDRSFEWPRLGSNEALIKEEIMWQHRRKQ